MAPRKTAKKQDARPKRAKNKRGGTQKEKKNKQNKRVRGGVLLLPDLYLFKKKSDVDEKNQRRENKPQKTPDLTSREFFRHFREQTAKKKTKT